MKSKRLRLIASLVKDAQLTTARFEIDMQLASERGVNRMRICAADRNNGAIVEFSSSDSDDNKFVIADRNVTADEVTENISLFSRDERLAYTGISIAKVVSAATDVSKRYRSATSIPENIVKGFGDTLLIPTTMSITGELKNGN